MHARLPLAPFLAAVSLHVAGAASLQASSPHASGAGRAPLSFSSDPGSGVGPLRVAPELDCAVRWLAYNFSQHLLPWADASLVGDALRLVADCGAPPPPPRSPSASAAAASAAPNPVSVPARGTAVRRENEPHCG